MAGGSIGLRMGGTDWALLVVLSLLWGGSFFFVGVAIAALPPFTIVFLRVALAAVALQLFLRLSMAGMPSGHRVWTTFAVMGFLNNVVPFSLIVWGQTRIDSGLASILNATTPIFTVMLAHMLTSDERLTAGRLAGVVLGLAGVAILLGREALAGLGGDLAAQTACVAAALSYAAAGVFGRHFARMGITPAQAAAGQVTASSVILLPLVLLGDRPWTLPPPGFWIWVSIAGLALLSTALAYILYFRILASAGATNLLLVTLLIPPTAILLGATILGEHLGSGHFLGMAFIALGIAAIDGRPAQATVRLLTARSG